MHKFFLAFSVFCFLLFVTAFAQNNSRVQPKFKTVYLPTKKINQALQNAFVIDSLIKRLDSMSAINADLLGKISEKENLLNELISLADSEAIVIKKAQLQIAALETKNNKAKSTGNLLIVIAVFSTICAIVFLILLLTRKRTIEQPATLKRASVAHKETKQVTVETMEPRPPVSLEPTNSAVDLSRKRDSSHTVIQLERLAKMLEMGILTQEEFASQKRDVLKDR